MQELTQHFTQRSCIIGFSTDDSREPKHNLLHSGIVFIKTAVICTCHSIFRINYHTIQTDIVLKQFQENQLMLYRNFQNELYATN